MSQFDIRRALAAVMPRFNENRNLAPWERRRIAGPAKNRNAIVIIYIELLSPNAVLPKLLPAGRWRSQDALRQKVCGIGRDAGAQGSQVSVLNELRRSRGRSFEVIALSTAAG